MVIQKLSASFLHSRGSERGKLSTRIAQPCLHVSVPVQTRLRATNPTHARNLSLPLPHSLTQFSELSSAQSTDWRVEVIRVSSWFSSERALDRPWRSDRACCSCALLPPLRCSSPSPRRCLRQVRVLDFWRFLFPFSVFLQRCSSIHALFWQ